VQHAEVIDIDTHPSPVISYHTLGESIIRCINKSDEVDAKYLLNPVNSTELKLRRSSSGCNCQNSQKRELQRVK
jgi:hypothetical protein